MNPKKPKTLLTNLSEDLNIDSSLVNDVIDFYWSNVRKNVISVSYPKINIENLGVFELKWKKLNETIEKYKNRLSLIGDLNFARFSKYQYTLDRIQILEKAKEVMVQELERKKSIKTERYGNSNRSMEKEG